MGDNDTNTFLSSLTSKEVWIGGYQNQNNDWTWSDGTEWVFTSWASGQPNSGHQNHVAFNFGTPRGWNDANKHSEREFLCQYNTGEFSIVYSIIHCNHSSSLIYGNLGITTI